MKKKFEVTSKDKSDWTAFTKQMGKPPVKEEDLSSNKNQTIEKLRKLDLHGFSLSEANKEVNFFLTDSYEKNFKKILIVTGKGLRSKSHENPYVSEKLNTLRFSVPEFIKNDEFLNSIISSITPANQNDGGDGAIYIFFKKKIKE